MEKSVFVTQPSLPNLNDFLESLERIWENKWLTNNGEFHKQFESELATYLGVNHISLFSNGTLALMTAMQVLGINGEVITTPYSFVATTHAMLWNKLKPVFCDVDPIYGNLDPNKIEHHITENTSAIVPVHVYGNPADVEKIEAIAQKYHLKVIYDAAHAFGVEKNMNSILNCGDLSVLSFHATKTFNTIEGGAIISHDLDTKTKIDQLKNFGFVNETTVVEAGINAKMNELQAAFGLLQLKTVDKEIEKRKKITDYYRNALRDIPGVRVLKDMPEIKHNYSYFPIFITKEYPLSRDELYEKLKMNGIFGRRYFYPLISEFPMYNKYPSANQENLLSAHKLANEVICLPIYPSLEINKINKILECII